MATLLPSARWRDPESVLIDQAAPDAVLVAAPLGSHFTWTLTMSQVVHLHQQISSLLARRQGGAT